MGEHGKHRPLVRLAVAVWPVAAPVWAECRLAPLLALDVSSSVDGIEESKEVMETVLSVPDLPVALGVFEWSGRDRQALALPWRVLTKPEDVLASAAKIRASRRSHTEFPTAIGNALG